MDDTFKHNWLLFTSDLFLDHQSDEDLNRWMLGGDCLGWIYARLIADQRIVIECDPVMEDWGWYASVRMKDTKISIRLLLYSYIERYWLLCLLPRNSWFWKKPYSHLADAQIYVASAIDRIISDTRFQSFGWREDDQFEVLKQRTPTNHAVNGSSRSRGI